MLNLSEIKKDFPILSREIDGKKLVYLDNAATTQKPSAVIAAISNYYEHNNSNVHRGLHTLSEESTELYENTRKKVSEFIGAAHPKEVIFTKGTTESLNMVAQSWAISKLKKDDIILVTNIEHHSNLVPWQVVAEKTGAELKVLDVYMKEEKDILLQIKQELRGRVKIISLTQASNVTGAILPVSEISKLAKEAGALVCVDGAQAVPHMKVNVQKLGCDFYSFSAHKMLGPTGVGVLWARQELLEEMSPYQYGGGMIDEVDLVHSTWAEVPEKFEAGTPNIAGVVGLGAAIDYLTKIGMDNIRAHEAALNKYALDKLTKIDGLEIIGTKSPETRAGIISFTLKNIHSHDLASVLNTEGVAVRSGHHCVMPLHTKLNISASTRASYYIYNDENDVDTLIKGIYKAIDILG